MKADLLIKKRIPLQKWIASLDYTKGTPQTILVAIAHMVLRIDLEGKVYWTFGTNGSVTKCRLGTFQDRQIVICGGFDYFITYLDLNDGIPYFPKYPLRDPLYSLELFQSGDNILACAGRTALVLNPPQTDAVWIKKFSKPLICSQTSNDGVYIGGLDNNVRKLTLEGEFIWEKQFDSPPQTITVFGSDLIIGFASGQAICLSSEGEENWRINLRKPISTANFFRMTHVDARYLLITTLEGKIFLFDEERCPIAELDIETPIFSACFNNINPSEYTFFIGTNNGELLLSTVVFE
ncbi:MAG: hypothetical protein ACFFC7_01145 [Candidatus Hermodarchaeota archaeon]